MLGGTESRSHASAEEQRRELFHLWLIGPFIVCRRLNFVGITPISLQDQNGTAPASGPHCVSTPKRALT